MLEELKTLQQIFNALTLAGENVLKIYNSDYKIETKADNSKVTEADHISNKIMVDFLKENYPYQIISEENENQKLTHAKTWALDPIDGTNDFIDKTGDFSIMLALFEKKKIIFSVVYLPLEKTFYYAIKNQGAFKMKNNQQTPLSLKIAEPKEYVMYTSRTHFSELEQKISQAVGISKFVEMGSIGIKIAKIAAGEGHVYINTSSKLGIWDLAPPALILEEANGFVVDLNNQNVDYQDEGFKILQGCIAATNRKMIAKISQAYREHSREHRREH